MAASDLSPAFRARLEPIFAALAEAVKRPAFELRLDPAAHRVRVQGGVVHVPVRFEVHWRRFETVPTDLVRDAAYEARRAVERDEADAQVFAERFLRDHLLEAD